MDGGNFSFFYLISSLSFSLSLLLSLSLSLSLAYIFFFLFFLSIIPTNPLSTPTLLRFVEGEERGKKENGALVGGRRGRGRLRRRRKKKGRRGRGRVRRRRKKKGAEAGRGVSLRPQSLASSKQ